MDLWNYSDLARLAPDPETLKRARGISFALKNWLTLAGNEKLVWGEYEGGGHQRYQVAVDLEQARFHCTCRSPRHPCKHALAMPLLLIRSNEHFRVAYDLPDWVKKAWSNASKTRKKPKVSTGPSDDRLLRMQGGLLELENWLTQIIENGLATIDPEDQQFWEDLAVRMTDSQLSGPAARLRSISQLPRDDDWYEAVLATLAELYLLIRAFKRYEQLPENLQQELLNVAGVSVRRDRVLTEPAVADRWLVTGIREEEESENLAYRRTWLLGEETGQQALLLDFNWNQQGYRENWPLGMVFDGKLHFYPGSYPLRALVGDFRKVEEPFVGLSGIFNFSEWPEYLSRALAGNPWLQTLPCLLAAVRPVWREERQWLLDTEEQALSIAIDDQAFWKIMAVSGGHPVSVFAEWENGRFRPLAVVMPDRVIEL
ncbi:SWIM zinc finger family protein [Flavilitoribacter nigricans]|uniref:SWIM-type domain-containing protein n=1 Tax=Flavilitoribacter nigricans (strain ATCC 23147 / DSM 23189 / NBRC 102662 / NCIMB 1420 / SS-2) TaxID=1122177 RepID=A0A2D0N8Z9_FLAN2|nr:SWIM zinc finger family protein [Flavilitoribacter nigricans]PHN04856.1 hypothetical protein CRP01_20325 [Flavilitoribacter nigricans DSM 23189 = NBRC 102662]